MDYPPVIEGLEGLLGWNARYAGVYLEEQKAFIPVDVDREHAKPCRELVRSSIYYEEPAYGYRFRTECVILDLGAGEFGYAHSGGEDQHHAELPVKELSDPVLLRLLRENDLPALKRYVELKSIDSMMDQLSQRLPMTAGGKAAPPAEPLSWFISLPHDHRALVALLAEDGLVDTRGDSRAERYLHGSKVAEKQRQMLLDHLLLYGRALVVSHRPADEEEAARRLRNPIHPANLLRPAIDEGIVEVVSESLFDEKLQDWDYPGICTDDELDDLRLFAPVLLPYHLHHRGKGTDPGQIGNALCNLGMIEDCTSWDFARDYPESLVESMRSRYQGLYEDFKLLAPHLRFSAGRRAPLLGLHEAMMPFDGRLGDDRLMPIEWDAVAQRWQTFRIVLQEAEVFPYVRTYNDVRRLRRDPRMRHFQKVLGRWSTEIAERGVKAQEDLRTEVHVANAALKKLGKWKKVSGWVGYASLPLAVASLAAGIPFGLAIAPISLGIRLYVDVTVWRNRWLLVGQ